MNIEKAEAILLKHFAEYPEMQPRDAVKLCYQATFGGGHMIADRNRALERLRGEIAETPQTGDTRVEEMPGGLARFHLQGFAASGLREETVNGLFCATAAEPRGSREEFLQILDLLRVCAERGDTPFSEAALGEYLHAYAEEGYPAVSHSETYRAAYAPAYRIVPGCTGALLPLLRAIDAKLREKGGVRVGIDGMCGSGKTTLAALLDRVYQPRLVHMDDYFLPFDRRTPERLGEPGGNLDRERVLEEICSRGNDEPMTVRRYDCSTGTLLSPVTLAPNRVLIAEGSYCLHPELRGTFDITVYLTVDPVEQRRRIQRRNGPEMWPRFENEWIPMENRYAEHFALRENADFVMECPETGC